MKKTLTNLILSSALLFNSNNILANQITLVGEPDHRNPIYRSQFIDILSQNPNKYDIVALESFESSKQNLLSNYSISQNSNTKSDLLDYLNNRWNYYNPNSYFQVITYSINNNLKLLAIDLDKSLQPKELIYPTPPIISKIRLKREQNMAKILCQNSINNNIIVLIGSAHLNELFLPKQIKISCNKTPKLIHLK